MTRAKKPTPQPSSVNVGDESFVIGKGPMKAGNRSLVIGDQLTAGDDAVVIGKTLFGVEIPDAVKALAETDPVTLRWLLNAVARQVVAIHRSNLKRQIELIDHALQPGVKLSRRDCVAIDEAWNQVTGDYWKNQTVTGE